VGEDQAEGGGVMTFDDTFDRLLGNEGGYVNNPADPGGETQWGISKRSYPTLDIKNLTRDQAKAIYFADFWTKGAMDQLPPALAFQAFDAAVNHGVEIAIRLTQRAAGVADDGHIGTVTLAAIRRQPVTDLLMLFIAQRLLFWTALVTWDKFGKGWARRAAADLQYAAKDA
jgi:lysozyme family protein